LASAHLPSSNTGKQHQHHGSEGGEAEFSAGLLRGLCNCRRGLQERLDIGQGGTLCWIDTQTLARNLRERLRNGCGDEGVGLSGSVPHGWPLGESFDERDAERP